MSIIYNLSLGLVWNQINDIINTGSTNPIINWILEFNIWDDTGYWIDTATWND